jgi:hypothetical protein
MAAVSNIFVDRPLGQRRYIFAPNHTDVLVLGKRRPVRRPTRSVIEPDWISHAPVERLPQNFLAAMRERGWLR